MKALDIYKGSNGELTRSYYAELLNRGHLGMIAMNLFRAQKSSERAKVYRGGIRGQGSFRGMAYERKGYAMEMLCAKLASDDAGFDINFGWKKDPKTMLHGDEAWVLYVDLPTGQVSFHSTVRYAGPDYQGEWDGQRASVERVLAFCDAVMEAQPIEAINLVQTEPCEPCSCAQQWFRNNSDGSRDFEMKGRPRCPKCQGRGVIRRCTKCEGAGIVNSQRCGKCGGNGCIPA